MDANLQSKLSKFGQEHVLTFYESLNPTQQKSLIDEISRLDFERLARIFKKATTGTHEKTEIKLAPFPKSSFDSLLTASKETLSKWYENGLRLIAENKVAVILLAGNFFFLNRKGGQGTRLGSSDPKGCYDIGLPSKASLFELQGKRLLKLQQVSNFTI